MKKIISVFLASLMLLSVFGCLGFAADGYKNTYSVNLEEETANRMIIVPVKYPVEKNEDGTFVTEDSYYVAEGDNFYFVVVPNGSYAFDQTTMLKAYPESIYVDVLQGRDAPGTVLSPDADGVYCLTNVTSDTVVTVYNLQDESLASVKDFLMNFANFFLNLFNWFFGLFRRTA